MMSAPVPNRRMYLNGTDGGALRAYEDMVIDQAVKEKLAIVMLGPHRVNQKLRRRTAGVEQQKCSDGFVNAREIEVRLNFSGESVYPCRRSQWSCRSLCRLL